MKLDVHRGFVSAAECAELNQWVVAGIKNGYVDEAPMVSSNGNTRSRYSTRSSSARFNAYPQLAYTVFDRIRNEKNLRNRVIARGHGKHGIVVSCTQPGGDVPAHKDPHSYGDLHTLRCNVITQMPESGGVLHINGEPVDLEQGDLHCYLVTKHEHYVTEVTGNTPRILWMFGVCITAEQWGE